MCVMCVCVFECEWMHVRTYVICVFCIQKSLPFFVHFSSSVKFFGVGIFFLSHSSLLLCRYKPKEKKRFSALTPSLSHPIRTHFDTLYVISLFRHWNIHNTECINFMYRILKPCRFTFEYAKFLENSLAVSQCEWIRISQCLYI